MHRSRRRRTRRFFWLLLIPLFLLVVMQAVLSFGTVILGGTFTTLQNYAADRLGQVTETRQIILEGQMAQQWSGIDEAYDVAQQTLDALLAERGATLGEFLADREMQESYLTSLLPTWSYMMRTNSTTGAFLVLTPPDTARTGGEVNALYLRDADPDTNPASYSDLQLTVGPSSVAQSYQIPLDILWRPRLTLLPEGEREADRFVYAPLLAAQAQTTQNPKNDCFWSRAFRLEDNREDAYRMITYSLPLMTEEGEVCGVMGVEISLSYLEENLPYREVDSGHEGGYLLLERAEDGSYRLVDASGPMAGQAVMGQESIRPAVTSIRGLYRLDGAKPEVYLTLRPLRLYNTNTPFYEQGWYLAGLESHSALFGISDTLSRVFVAATLVSLAAAIVLALLLVRHVTRPIRRLSACIQNSRNNELGDFPPSHIAEVDELYGTIERLTERQKQAEYELMEEKERYRLALQSSSDVLISYNPALDRAVLYNLDSGGEEEVVEGLLDRAHDYIHPDDRRIVLARMAEMQDEISVSFRVKWPGRSEGYRWYELNGRVLPAGEGRSRTLIGALHNIHDQKLEEMAAYESLHRDSLTGLYLRSSGEDIVRNSMQNSGAGCLLLFDLRGLGALNSSLGIVAGNTVLEALGQLLLRWQQGTPYGQSAILRLGGDEFLIWLENYDKPAALSVAETICHQAEALYTEGSFRARLLCGAAQLQEGESYPELLARACAALAFAREKNALRPVWAEEEEIDLAAGNEAISPIEYTASPQRSLVPLTFAFFDRGGDVGSVLALLFPKLGYELGASDILLTEVSRDFFTVTAAHQWHASGEAGEHTLIHYAAPEFAALENELWGETGLSRPVDGLTEAQRRFLCVPEERAGMVFPLFDSGTYMGALLFLHEKEREPWERGQVRQLLEVVKVIESNLNRQRYDLASRAKSDFLSRMSHEIRTPMNAIIGMTYIARTHTNDEAAVAADLEKIDQSSHYLLGLINDILDMSRIESGKLTLENTAFDLMHMLEGVGDLIRPQAEGKRIRYRLEAEIDRPWVTGDPLHLNQVLINLLGNAVKFTPEEGEISLEVRQGSGQSMFFAVRDTGIGVAPENQQRIFNSFEQAERSTARQYGGTGLGLAISGRLVRMMGGIIELDSAPGKGSCFSFTISLPVCTPPEQATPEEAEADENAVSDLHILLVEDNELNIEIAQSILEMHGAHVTLAYNGKEAVERFTQSKPGEFDLILMDIQMPVMDGLEATKAIRRSDHPLAASIPIIAMTANAFDEDMKRSVESGMNGHLSKPLDFDKVFRVIAQVLGRDE